MKIRNLETGSIGIKSENFDQYMETLKQKINLVFEIKKLMSQDIGITFIDDLETIEISNNIKKIEIKA